MIVALLLLLIFIGALYAAPLISLAVGLVCLAWVGVRIVLSCRSVHP